MTRPELAWGAAPSERYEAVASRFRPLFATLREGAAQRDLDRRLPYDEFAELKRAGFGALRAIDLVLQAATIAFDALGASAVRRSAALDRHWRNARTLASHNPRIYKERIVGDYAVNAAAPPPQWRIGQA